MDVHLGPDARLHLFDFIEKHAEPADGQGAAAARFHHYVQAGGATSDFLALCYAGIARVAKYLTLLPLQQGMGLRDVVRIGRRAPPLRGDYHGMHGSRIGINPDMGRHAEAPRIAFLRLMHFGIARPVLILGRTRCAMIVASTIMPWRNSRPRSLRSALTCASSCFSSS